MFLSPAEEDALLELLNRLHREGYRYTTVTPATHARVNERPGNAWARDLRGIFGWSRPFRGELLAQEWLDLMRDAGVLEPYGGSWRSRVRVSSLRGLLFLHSAWPTEAPNAVFFGPDSYRFVHAIETHLRCFPRPIRRAVEIGCGAGPGAILLRRAQPQAEVVAVDINPAALALARVNARFAQVTLDMRHSNLLEDVEGQFDLILANPPYLNDPAQRTYRHGGGSHGEALSLAILETALERLAPGGCLLLYTGVAICNGEDPFEQAVRERLAEMPVELDYQELDPDVFGEELSMPAYADTERIAAVVLTLFKR